jgi:hypothetical protein
MVVHLNTFKTCFEYLLIAHRLLRNNKWILRVQDLPIRSSHEDALRVFVQMNGYDFMAYLNGFVGIEI